MCPTLYLLLKIWAMDHELHYHLATFQNCSIPEVLSQTLQFIPIPRWCKNGKHWPQAGVPAVGSIR